MFLECFVIISFKKTDLEEVYRRSKSDYYFDVEVVFQYLSNWKLDPFVAISIQASTEYSSTLASLRVHCRGSPKTATQPYSRLY